MLNYNLLLSHSKAFIQGFSYYYPLTEELLGKYEDIWDWKLVSGNKAIQWNVSLLKKFQDNWDWGYRGLSNNESLPWSPAFLRQFKEKWSWYHLGCEAKVVNDPDMLAMCFTEWNSWDQENLLSGGMADLYVDSYWWAEDFFESCSNLNWNYLSAYNGFPWSSEFIRQHADKWNWEELSKNKALPWNMELIYEHLHKWDWYSLSDSSALPWSIELIEAFIEHWNWSVLSRNMAIQWTAQMLIAFKDQLDWAIPVIEPGDYIGAIEGLYDHPAILWTPELFEACNLSIVACFNRLVEEQDDELKANNITIVHENKHWTVYQQGSNWSESYMEMLLELSKRFPGKRFINWKKIGLNFKNWEDWSKEMIIYCLAQIDLYDLTQNPYFPWHKHPELFQHLAVHNNCWNNLSANKGVHWTEAMLEQYEDKWDWNRLSSNPNLTLTLIKKYAGYWNWEEILKSKAFTPEIIKEYPDKLDLWWWLMSLHKNPPFKTYNNFLQLLNIPAEASIEQWINSNMLESVLQQIINKFPAIYKRDF